MRSAKNYPKIFLLAMVMAFLLFMNLALGLLAGSAPALASPDPGWVNQGTIDGVSSLSAIDAVDNNVAWAVGDGTIVKTINGGTAWTPQTSPTNAGLDRLDAVDANTAWAAGDFGGLTSVPAVISTSNGGTSWQLHDTSVFASAPVPFPYNLFTQSWSVGAVAAIDANTAWVAVNYRAYYYVNFDLFYQWLGSGIWKTTDGGSSWTLQVFTNLPPLIRTMKAFDSQTIWACGETAALRSTDGGNGWQTQPFGNLFLTFSIVNSNVAIGGGLYELIKTNDGGQTWSVISSSEDIRGIAAVDSNVMWVESAMTPQGIFIKKSIDGGQTWTTQVTGQEVGGLIALDPATAWCIGSILISAAVHNFYSLKTTDGGDARPDVLSVSPQSATWGDQVTIKGVDFGATQGTSFVVGVENAADYVSWSDTQIVVKVPVGTSGVVPVIVTTAAGSSNAGSLTVIPAMSVTSITPNWANTGSEVEVTIAGTGFATDAVVSLKSGGTVMSPTSTTFVSATQLTCKFTLTDAAVGTYDVIVSNPGGYSASFARGFSVTAPSPCGFGSGLGILMLGISLGLLSLAGTIGRKKKS